MLHGAELGHGPRHQVISNGSMIKRLDGANDVPHQLVDSEFYPLELLGKQGSCCLGFGVRDKP